MTSEPKRVVLAYSGGLDTSVILRWLIERYRCAVVAFCADLGQGEELLPIREKALHTGALARVGAHLAHRPARIRAPPRHPGAGHGRTALQHRPEPVPHLLRGRDPGGPVGRAAGEDVPAHE